MRAAILIDCGRNVLGGRGPGLEWSRAAPLSRLEAGATVPTIPVLERIAAALGAELIVTIAP